MTWQLLIGTCQNLMKGGLYYSQRRGAKSNRRRGSEDGRRKATRCPEGLKTPAGSDKL